MTALSSLHVLPSILRSVPDAPLANEAVDAGEDGPLAVLGLLEDNRLGPVEDVVVDLLLVAREAVHEEAGRLGAAAREEVVRDLEAGKVLHPTRGLFFLSHRDPGWRCSGQDSGSEGKAEGWKS